MGGGRWERKGRNGNDDEGDFVILPIVFEVSQLTECMLGMMGAGGKIDRVPMGEIE